MQEQGYYVEYKDALGTQKGYWCMALDKAHAVDKCARDEQIEVIAVLSEYEYDSIFGAGREEATHE